MDASTEPTLYHAYNPTIMVTDALRTPTCATADASVAPARRSVVMVGYVVHTPDPDDIDRRLYLLHVNISRGDHDAVVDMVEETPWIADHADAHGFTPLMDAAASGRIDITLYLIERGACVSRSTEKGDTALAHAAIVGHAPVVVELISRHGADVCVTDDSGNTALMHAAMHGHEDVVEVLLQQSLLTSGLLDARCVLGRTALTKACMMGHAGVVKRLLDAGADAFGVFEDVALAMMHTRTHTHAHGANTHHTPAAQRQRECVEVVEDWHRCYHITRALWLHDAAHTLAHTLPPTHTAPKVDMDVCTDDTIADHVRVCTHARVEMSSVEWVENELCVDPSMDREYDVWDAGCSVVCTDTYGAIPTKIQTSQMLEGGVEGPVSGGCGCVHLCSCAIETMHTPVWLLERAAGMCLPSVHVAGVMDGLIPTDIRLDVDAPHGRHSQIGVSHSAIENSTMVCDASHRQTVGDSQKTVRERGVEARVVEHVLKSLNLELYVELMGLF